MSHEDIENAKQQTCLRVVGAPLGPSPLPELLCETTGCEKRSEKYLLFFSALYPLLSYNLSPQRGEGEFTERRRERGAERKGKHFGSTRRQDMRLLFTSFLKPWAGNICLLTPTQTLTHTHTLTYRQWTPPLYIHREEVNPVSENERFPWRQGSRRGERLWKSPEC